MSVKWVTLEAVGAIECRYSEALFEILPSAPRAVLGVSGGSASTLAAQADWLRKRRRFILFLGRLGVFTRSRLRRIQG